MRRKNPHVNENMKSQLQKHNILMDHTNKNICIPNFPPDSPRKV